MFKKNTALVVWNPEDYDFEQANAYILKKYDDMSKAKSGESAGACSSWRNGKFHGRNLDWYQANYGCLIIQMPKGGNVRHASVALLNSNTTVTQKFIADGVIDESNRKILPSTVVDGINDAGVAININIVPHTPDNPFVDEEGDLSSQCVVRYVLDNAGSVDEAITLLKGKKIRQGIVKIAEDETHYMISDKTKTAIVEFDKGEMVVTCFNAKDNGWYSEKGNPAIMTNLYAFAAERWGLGTNDFYENSPYALGVERWQTIKNQYDKASQSVESNFEIAKSVWYFKGLMTDKNKWYTENAVPTAYGKDSEGWYYMEAGNRVACDDSEDARIGYWNAAMEQYWASYVDSYGSLSDPHVEGNVFWETSHTVVYDLDAKQGYLYPFENFYSEDGKPIVISLPE